MIHRHVEQLCDLAWAAHETVFPCEENPVSPFGPTKNCAENAGDECAGFAMMQLRRDRRMQLRVRELFYQMSLLLDSYDVGLLLGHYQQLVTVLLVAAVAHVNMLRLAGLVSEGCLATQTRPGQDRLGRAAIPPT